RVHAPVLVVVEPHRPPPVIRPGGEHLRVGGLRCKVQAVARQIRPRLHRIVVVQAQFGCVPPAHQVLVEVQRRQEPSTERMSETVGEQHQDDTSPTAENSTSLADAVRTVTASPLRSGYDPSSNDSPPGRAKSYAFQCTDPPDGV